MTFTAEEKRDAVRKSKWALAYLLQEWKRETSRIGRKAYNRGEGPTDPELCVQFAEKLEGMARTAREAASLAREEIIQDESLLEGGDDIDPHSGPAK